MGANNLLDKCDRALVTFLISEGAGTAADVFPAKHSGEKPMPCTICQCRPARTHGSPFSGTYEVNAAVRIRSTGIFEEPVDNESGVPSERSGDRVAATNAAFEKYLNTESGKDLAAAITSVAPAGLTIDDVIPDELDAGFNEKGDAWTDVVFFRLIARAAP